MPRTKTEKILKDYKISSEDADNSEFTSLTIYRSPRKRIFETSEFLQWFESTQDSSKKYAPTPHRIQGHWKPHGRGECSKTKVAEYGYVEKDKTLHRRLH